MKGFHPVPECRQTCSNEISKEVISSVQLFNDLKVYLSTSILTIISAAGVCWINSAEFLLTIDRVVGASNSRNIIIVIVRNVPHPALPDGPARGRRQGGADDDGEDQELKERPSYWWSVENISYHNENLHLTDIFQLIQRSEKIKYLY